MEFSDLLEIGAKMIQNNDDDSTTSLDLGDITSALGSILGNSDGEGGVDIASIVSNFAQNGLHVILLALG